MLKSRRAIAFERHDEDVAAVEHRDRHQVEQPEVQADRRHQAEQRDPARPAPTHRTAARSPTGPISCFGDVSPVTRPQSVLRISPAISMLRCDAQPIASIGAGLNASRLVGDADADARRVAVAARASRTIVCSSPSRRIGHRRSACSGCFEIASTQLAREDHALAVDREDDVAALRPARFGGLAGHDRRDVRIDVRQHADVADLEPAPRRARAADRDRARSRPSRTTSSSTSRSGRVPTAMIEVLPGVDASVG